MSKTTQKLIPLRKKSAFALLKPDAFDTEKKMLEVLRFLHLCGFRILERRLIKKPTAAQIVDHFRDLRKKNEDAFNRNFAFFFEGPVLALHLDYNGKGDAITALRDTVGATNPPEAKIGTIRHAISTDSIAKATRERRGVRNTIHASDSKAALRREYDIWFKKP